MNPDQAVPQEAPRVQLHEAGDSEQLERFKDIKSLYAEVEGRDPDRSQFIDFYQNAYKYLDTFNVQGSSGEKLRPVFNQALAGNDILKLALEVYQEDKKTTLGVANRKRESIGALDAMLKRYKGEPGYDFIDKAGKLNVDQLTSLFEWSANTFIKGGEKAGRKFELPSETVKPMTDDMREILQGVNFYR